MTEPALKHQAQTAPYKQILIISTSNQPRQQGRESPTVHVSKPDSSPQPSPSEKTSEAQDEHPAEPHQQVTVQPWTGQSQQPQQFGISVSLHDPSSLHVLDTSQIETNMVLAIAVTVGCSFLMGAVAILYSLWAENAMRHRDYGTAIRKARIIKYISVVAAILRTVISVIEAIWYLTSSPMDQVSTVGWVKRGKCFPTSGFDSIDRSDDDRQGSIY